MKTRNIICAAMALLVSVTAMASNWRVRADEATVSTLTGNEYIQHTYLCSGYIEDYTGECRVQIWGNEDDQIFDDCKIKAAGDNTSFAFSFTTKDEYLDRPSWNFIVKVCNNNGKVLFRTMQAATHPGK